jgi:hypothetical protein
LNDKFGAKGADGILFCLGRSTFTRLLIWMGEEAGFSQKEFKLLPLRKKIPAGMRNLARVFCEGQPEQIEVRSQDQMYEWVMSGAGSHVQSGCMFFRGLLQEYMAWMCSGKVFIVEEVTCRKGGAAECCFRIPANSIE